MAILWLILPFQLLVGSGCSDASLYGVGLDAPTADRVGLTGRVCTDDPRDAGFPVRVLFLVDVALGPLFATYDPEGIRLAALREAVGMYAGNQDYAFGVVGFGGTSRRLAPEAGAFTRNPGELENGIAMLGIPQGCVEGRCRDYAGALTYAQSLIEGDLASLSAGTRGRTQYVVVLVSAGPPAPLSCQNQCCTDCGNTCVESWECTHSSLPRDVDALQAAVENAGALSFSLHTLLLAAEDLSQPDPAESLEETANLMQELSFAGAGRYERFDTADAITLDHLGLIKLTSLLEPKGFLVSNHSVLPSADGGRPDSDGDGLADGEELGLGTSPGAADTDGDGLGDALELRLGKEPVLADPLPGPCLELDAPRADADRDGLNACEERLLGTDPSLPDSDGDGLPERLELLYGTDYLRADDLNDADWDGVKNGDELRAHTDPRSSDAAAALGSAYRYEVLDEGVVREPSVSAPKVVQGLSIYQVGIDSTGGLGTLRYLPGMPAYLSWVDPQDSGPGLEVAIVGPGLYRLESGSVGAAGLERWLEVNVEPARLPPMAAEELLLVELSERHCLSFTVKNIFLTETSAGEGGGLNDLFLYFAEAPAGRLTEPGLLRMAHVPVTYHQDTGRQPAGAILEVREGDFVTVGE